MWSCVTTMLLPCLLLLYIILYTFFYVQDCNFITNTHSLNMVHVWFEFNTLLNACSFVALKRNIFFISIFAK
jgi:hypothetical protein